MSGSISDFGVWNACSVQELHGLLLLIGRDGAEDLLAVREPEVVVNQAADDVGDVAELAVSLADQLAVDRPAAGRSSRPPSPWP